MSRSAHQSRYEPVARSRRGWAHPGHMTVSNTMNEREMPRTVSVAQQLIRPKAAGQRTPVLIRRANGPAHPPQVADLRKHGQDPVCGRIVGTSPAALRASSTACRLRSSSSGQR